MPHPSTRLCALLACCLLVGCSGFTRVFRGNTRKEFGAYDIEERQQYKHYLDNKAIQKRERDREILKRLDDAPVIKTKNPKLHRDGKSADRKSRKKREYSWLARIIRRLFRLEE